MRQTAFVLVLIAAAALVSSLAGCGRAAVQRPDSPTAPAPGPARPLALNLAPPMSAVPLAVSSTAIGAGGRLADRITAWHENLSPPLAWGSVAGVQTWVVIVEDPDANRPEPYIHWLAWNIPARTASLPEGLTQATLPSGMVQGFNSGFRTGWGGPRPPKGTGDHHYHFQVFALDTAPELPRMAGREAVIAAMKGHILASGETVGTYSAPD